MQTGLTHSPTRTIVLALVSWLTIFDSSLTARSAQPTPEQARAVAKEAYIYGYAPVYMERQRRNLTTADKDMGDGRAPQNMYGLPSSLLIANPINRYLINSPMLPDLKRDADGGLTIYIQHDSPGTDEESNWLPAPEGLFFSVLRLYWPKEAALDGAWKSPPIKQVE